MCAKQVKKPKISTKTKPKKASAKKATKKKVEAKIAASKASSSKKSTKKSTAKPKKASTSKSMVSKKEQAKKASPSKSKVAKKTKDKKVESKNPKSATKKASNVKSKTVKGKATQPEVKDIKPTGPILLKKLPPPPPKKRVVKKGERTAKNLFPEGVKLTNAPKKVAPSKPNKNRKTRYTEKELEFFKKLIDKKLIEAQSQLEFYLEQIKNTGTNPDSKLKGLDDGTSTTETEQMYSLAARQRKYIQHLENAKLRIKNKIYGVCRVTGNLISKERLKAVPHATLSMNAKLKS